MLILILRVYLVLQAFCFFFSFCSFELLTFSSSLSTKFQVLIDLRNSLVTKILYPWTKN